MSNDGSPHDGVIQDAIGKIDGADEFDGTNDDIQVAHDASLTGFTEGMTVSAWIKFDKLPTTAGNDAREYIFNKLANVGTRNSWFFAYWYHPTNGKVLQFLTSQDGTLRQVIRMQWARFEPVVGQWYQVVAVWESNMVPKFYVNGVLATAVYNTGTVSSIYSDTEPLYIGECAYNTSRNFNGSIDEARISNTARSEGWIYTKYMNQQNPSDFYSLGEADSIYDPVLTSPYPSDEAIDVELNPTLSIQVADPQAEI